MPVARPAYSGRLYIRAAGSLKDAFVQCITEHISVTGGDIFVIILLESINYDN